MLQTINEIIMQWRQRQAWLRAETKLTLQAKALCRGLAGGDKGEGRKLYDAALGKGEHPDAIVAAAAIMPLIEGRAHVERARKAIEKRLELLAKTLPVWPAVQKMKGLGALSLAGIVGEAGDLSLYASKSKLWKRMGMAVMPDGRRQQLVAGLTQSEALAIGYAPRRAALMFVIGGRLKMAKGHYYEVMNRRKDYERQRAEAAGLIVAPSAEIPKKRRDEFMSLGQIENRARRYGAKMMLRDLRREWIAAHG